MDIETLASSRPALLALFTVLNVLYSWAPLHNPRSHGFYRFFVFEGVLLLLLINGSSGPMLAPGLDEEQFSGHQHDGDSLCGRGLLPVAPHRWSSST